MSKVSQCVLILGSRISSRNKSHLSVIANQFLVMPLWCDWLSLCEDWQSLVLSQTPGKGRL